MYETQVYPKTYRCLHTHIHSTCLLVHVATPNHSMTFAACDNSICKRNMPKQSKTNMCAGQSMSAPSFNGKPWKTLSPCINKTLWVKTSLALQENSFDPYPRCKNHRSTFSRCWRRGPLFTKMPKVVLKSLLSNLGAWHRLASQAALRT